MLKAGRGSRGLPNDSLREVDIGKREYPGELVYALGAFTPTRLELCRDFLSSQG